MAPILVLVLVLAVLGTVSYLAHRARQQRRLAVFAFATRFGLTYSRRDPLGLLGLPFPLLSMGERRGVENVVSGDWKGVSATAADYWYATESTDGRGRRSRSSRRFSILVVELPAYLPQVAIEREDLGSRLAGHLGFRDVAFESESFNRRFKVSAADREFAFKLVDARMIHFLEWTGGRFAFEVDGSTLLVHTEQLRPEELVTLFGMGRTFVDRVPRLVWTQYGSGSGRSPLTGERSPA